MFNSWSLSRSSAGQRKWQDIFKMLKGKKIYNQNYSTQQEYHSKLMEIKMLFRQVKVKRIQYHQTSFQQMLKELI